MRPGRHRRVGPSRGCSAPVGRSGRSAGPARPRHADPSSPLQDEHLLKEQDGSSSGPAGSRSTWSFDHGRTRRPCRAPPLAILLSVPEASPDTTSSTPPVASSAAGRPAGDRRRGPRALDVVRGAGCSARGRDRRAGPSLAFTGRLGGEHGTLARPARRPDPSSSVRSVVMPPAHALRRGPAHRRGDNPGRPDESPAGPLKSASSWIRPASARSWPIGRPPRMSRSPRPISVRAGSARWRSFTCQRTRCSAAPSGWPASRRSGSASARSAGALVSLGLA